MNRWWRIKFGSNKFVSGQIYDFEKNKKVKQVELGSDHALILTSNFKLFLF